MKSQRTTISKSPKRGARSPKKRKDQSEFRASWMAKKLGKPKAARAVGGASARNPVALIIPCHRLVGSNGSPTGYGGGTDKKRWLLEHEKAFGQSDRKPIPKKRGSVLFPYEEGI